MYKTYSNKRGTEEDLTDGSKSLKKNHLVKLRDVLKDTYEYNGVTCVAMPSGSPTAPLPLHLLAATATTQAAAAWAC